MPDTLATLIVEILGDTSALDAAMDNAVSVAGQRGGQAGSTFAIGFANPIMNAIGGVNTTLRSIGQGVDFAANFSGMRAAAELGYYRRALQGIAGDWDKAEQAYRSFQNIAEQSKFDSKSVFDFGLRQAGQSGDVVNAANKTQTLIDAAEAFKVSRQNFNYFQQNLGDIERKGDKKASVVDVRQFNRAAPLATTEIARAYEITVSEAAEKVRSSTGNELTEMINRVGLANKGAAAKAAGADPFTAASNIGDAAKNAIAPTGALLNSVLAPALQNVQNAIAPLRSLNELSHGFLGLAGVLGLGTIGVLRFTGTARAAWGTTTVFTTALREFSAVTEAATFATVSASRAARDKAMAEEQEAIATRLNRGFGMSPYRMPGVPFYTGPYSAPLSGQGKAWETIGRGISAVKTMAPYGIGIGMDIGGSKLSEGHDVGSWQHEVGVGMQDVGIGVGFGAPFGPIGALIGGLLGAGAAGYQVYKDLRAPKDKADNTNDSLKDAADSLKNAAGNLENVSGRVYGGGARAAATTSAIERDYILMHMAGVK